MISFSSGILEVWQSCSINILPILFPRLDNPDHFHQKSKDYENDRLFGSYGFFHFVDSEAQRAGFT
jgi:hypothetical protein